MSSDDDIDMTDTIESDHNSYWDRMMARHAIDEQSIGTHVQSNDPDAMIEALGCPIDDGACERSTSVDLDDDDL
jgi:hypothetical protein